MNIMGVCCLYGERIVVDYAELSLEQQYTLRVLSEQVKDLSKEEAQQNLIDLYRQMMIRENYQCQANHRLANHHPTPHR